MPRSLLQRQPRSRGEVRKPGSTQRRLRSRSVRLPWALRKKSEYTERWTLPPVTLAAGKETLS